MARKIYLLHQISVFLKQEWLKKIFSTLLSVAILFLLGRYLYQERQVFSLLRNINFFNVLLVLFLNWFLLSIIGIINHLIFSQAQSNIPFGIVMCLQYTTKLFNLLIPNFGATYRAVYLKQNYKFSYTSFLSTVASFSVINIFVNSFLGLLSLIFIYIKYKIIQTSVVLIFGIVFSATAILLVIKPKIGIFKNQKIFIKINNALIGYAKINKNLPLLLLLIILTCILFLGSAFRSYFIIHLLNEDVGLLESFFLSSISSISHLINITPGGLGIQEGAYLLSSRIIQVPDEILVLVSLTEKILIVITSLFLGVTSYFILEHHSKKKRV